MSGDVTCGVTVDVYVGADGLTRYTFPTATGWVFDTSSTEVKQDRSTIAVFPNPHAVYFTEAGGME